MVLSFLVESIGPVMIYASDYATHAHQNVKQYRIPKLLWRHGEAPEVGCHYITEATHIGFGFYMIGKEVEPI